VALPAYLDACDRQLQAADRRLLLTLDEYEYIDRKLGESVFDEDLLTLIRESIQSHRYLTWVFAGSHHIAELTHAEWTSYLVSTRTLEVPPFTLEEPRRLLTEPLRYSPLWEQDDPDRPCFEPGFWGPGGSSASMPRPGVGPIWCSSWPRRRWTSSTTPRPRNTSTRTCLERATDEAVEFGDTALRQLMDPDEAPRPSGPT